MARITVTIEGVGLAELAPYLQQLSALGVEADVLVPGATQIEVAAAIDAAAPSTQPHIGHRAGRWDVATMRLFIDGLTPQAFTVAQMLAEGEGIAPIAAIYARLNLTSGKAMGGVRSSFGNSARKVSDATQVQLSSPVTRDHASRTFRLDHLVLRMFKAAVGRRTQIEAPYTAAAAAPAPTAVSVSA